MKKLGIHRLSTPRMGNHLLRQPSRSSAKHLSAHQPMCMTTRLDCCRPSAALSPPPSSSGRPRPAKWAAEPGDFASIPPGFTNVTVLRCHVLDGYDNLPRGGLSPRLPSRPQGVQRKRCPLLIPPRRRPQPSGSGTRRVNSLASRWTQQLTGSGEGAILGRKYKSFALFDPPYDYIWMAVLRRRLRSALVLFNIFAVFKWLGFGSGRGPRWFGLVFCAV